MFRSVPPLHRTITISVVACLLAIAASALITVVTADAGHRSPLIDDPRSYQALISEIRTEGLPYVEVAVEHLPVALAPMFTASVLDAVLPLGYTLWFVLLMTTCIVGVAIAFDRMEAGKGMVVVVLISPMLPLILFRVEPWVLVLAAFGAFAAIAGRWSPSVIATSLATMAKAWPGFLFAFPWRGGRRAGAVAGLLVTAALLIPIILSPGFRSARSFTGIHTETLVGSAALLVRHLIGVDPGTIEHAGAAYVSTGSWAVVVNAMVGLPFIAIGVVLLLRASAGRRLFVPLGICVVGILLASPLFSAQFVSWLAISLVFAARRRQWFYGGLGALTVSTVAVWAPRNAVWAGAVLGRNVALVVLGAMLVSDAVRTSRAPELRPEATT